MSAKPRILIVEDDRYWIEHHRVALKNIDVDVDDAQTVKKGVELIASRPYSAVIVDLEIPGMKGGALGGFEILEATKRLNPYTELLVITAHKEPEILERVSRLNVRVITKPVDHRELAISTTAQIDSWNRRLLRIDQTLETFTYCQTALENRGHKRPAFRIVNEYDVQDLLHVMMKPYFPDVVTEEYTLKRADKTKRLDLVIPGLETVVETKMIRNKKHGTDIANELDIDVRGYVSHPNCSRLLCFVYDPQRHIKDARAVERDISGEASQDTKVVHVTVLIRPS
jgi:DNA-binding response OmpR family regulator